MPDWVRRRLAEGLGGVVLYAWNVESREQLRALTDDLRSERDDLLIAIDEEGGDVTRLEAATGSSYPGNGALGVVDDVDLTERVADVPGRGARCCRRQPRLRARRGRQHEPAEPGHRHPLVRRGRRARRATRRRIRPRAAACGRRGVRQALPRPRRHVGRLAPRASGGRVDRRSRTRAVPRGHRRGRAVDHDRAHRRAGARRLARHDEPRDPPRPPARTSSASEGSSSRTHSR